MILIDTTVLNNFAQVGRADLLKAAFSGLSCPAEVRAELAAGEALGLVPVSDWSWIEVIELTATERVRVTELERSLQLGEAACVAVAETRGGLVLTDDGAARRLAAKLGVKVSGTLGVLGRLVLRATLSLDQGDTVLVAMIAAGYRSPVSSLRELMTDP